MLVNALADHAQAHKHRDVPRHDPCRVCLEALVEGQWALFECFHHAVHDAGVLSGLGVHDASFEHIHWATDNTGSEPCNS